MFENDVHIVVRCKLLDYGDVVIHVFLEEIRGFYEIERLYGDVDRVGW